MFGKNPIRSPLKGDGNQLEIQEIFATFQGEGPYVGWPAVFVRLGGCNLNCSFCDTEFESFTSQPLDHILTTIETLAEKHADGHYIRNLVVITGGEPFRQPIEKLCEELISKGFSVQIETNGTLYRKIPREVDIICSPKAKGQKYHAIRDDLLQHVSAFKFIISAEKEGYTAISDIGQSAYAIPVYVQPMDEYDEARNKKNMEYAVKLALKQGYRISLQTHKIAGVA